ncbi:MAG: uncharacterized protein JWQ38_1745 [Flavipsychrobacter sp.]|nr:uncharacterized protein [Flavipsychrobacter sp.]
MINVAILVFEDSTPAAPVGAMDILNKASKFYHSGLAAKFPPPFFNVKLVYLKGKYVSASNGYPLYCHNDISEIEQTDLVLIAAPEGDMDEVLAKHGAYIPWINKQYAGGADIVSMCTGAFVLAATGLLKGKSATTHWAFTDEFAKRFPDTKVKSDKIIVDEGRVCTSGGALSFSSVIIYLVEKYVGADVAIHLSKLLVTELYKDPQNSYAIFSTQKTHSDEVVLQAQQFIEKQYHTELQVDELASQFAVSGRNFIRRFKKATGNTPLHYVQRVRIESAKKMLETNSAPVQNILFDVGYEDMSTFRKLFKKYTGLSPVDYRKKYTRLS